MLWRLFPVLVNPRQFGVRGGRSSSLAGDGGARRGMIGRTAIIAVASLVILAGLVSSLIKSPAPAPAVTSAKEELQPARSPLTVYCAASNKSVIEAIRADFEREYGTPLHVQYGASQTLLASIKVSGTGDLFLPADDSFLKLAHGQNLVAEDYPLAQMTAVVAVARGNPRGIARFSDLLQGDLRVAQGAFESTAIGKLTREALANAGQWDALFARTTVFKTTVNEVANDVKVGAVDAGIVFDAVLHDYDSLEAVRIPELEKVQAHVAVAVLNGSDRPREARRLARYIAAKDKGLARYAEFGFAPVEGDPWSEQPEITLYAGSMLRPAIEPTIAAFEEAEGVRVTRVYNGCGILVAQMKAGQVPDAYFACDSEFMNQVRDQFPSPLNVSQNELVILVQKGNPHSIRSLRDLATPGLRVGIGHEKQCAMGWITQRTFQESGFQSEVMKNVVVQTPTGDMLVNQMRSGSLDAAVAYLSNAAGAGDALEAIRIQGLACSIATQPFAVSKKSTHKQLVERLLAAVRAEASRQRFENEGFRWVDKRPTAHE